LSDDKKQQIIVLGKLGWSLLISVLSFGPLR
jgi:hypothetical protein